MSKGRPVWISPELNHLFERVIVKHREQPELWDDEFAPLPTLFLLFGQTGSDMEEALEALCIKHSIHAFCIEGSGFVDQCKRQMTEAMSRQADLLVIKKGDMLGRHHDLFESTLNLRKVMKYTFIIVISNEVPEPERHPFWQQFEVSNWILMSLPTKSWCLELLKYYFDGWSKHWAKRDGGKVALSDEDWNELASSCNYCTPLDIQVFCRKVVRHVQEYGCEEINWDWLSNPNHKFMYKSTTVTGLMNITQRDAHHAQSVYETKSGFGSRDAPSYQQAIASSNVEGAASSSKRVKLDTSDAAVGGSAASE